MFKFYFGWLCHKIVMAWPEPWNHENRIFMWLLSWAGYYANDVGNKRVNWGNHDAPF